MKFQLKSKSETPDNDSDFLMKHYELWKKSLKEDDNGFFMLYKNFEKFLPELTTGALKLYLFYGFSSKNITGESWYSIDSLAKNLDTTARSINTWNTELEQAGLIYRSSGSKSSKITYLLPYSDYTFHSSENIKEFVAKYKTSTFMQKKLGDISTIYHFYQWRRGDNPEVYDKSLNLLVLEFMREYKFNKSHRIDRRYTRAVFNLTELNKFQFDIKQQYMNKDTPILLFDTPIKIDLEEKIKGIVVNPKYNLLTNTTLNEILNQFRKDVDFTHYKFITHDKITWEGENE